MEAQNYRKEKKLRLGLQVEDLQQGSQVPNAEKKL